MKRILLIGNGFDLAHRLKTRYTDFIDDFWERKLDAFLKTVHEKKDGEISTNSNISQIPDGYRYSDHEIIIDFINNYSNQLTDSAIENYSGYKKFIYKVGQFRLKQYANNVQFINNFLERITENRQLYNWVDIEEEYYAVLLNCVDDLEKVKKLNEEFHCIQVALEQFLSRQLKTNIMADNQIIANINSRFSHPLYLESDYHIENCLFLNFNYTRTEKMYVAPSDKVIHIHGELGKPENPIIFGYGDETGDKYKVIEEKNKNILLENIKSIKYFETRNYTELIKFIESDIYEIFIMGHSCGISDRTLLKILFEHPNCLSIKVYYHKMNSVSDNYSDIVRNISRYFSDKSLMRKKVIDKKDSQPLS